MTVYLGDFSEDVTIDFKWNTNAATGASMDRNTTIAPGVVSVYKANGIGESTAGITDTLTFDGMVGVSHCRINLGADAFYTPGEYQVVLRGAEIDGVIVNACIAHFSIDSPFRRPSVNLVEWLHTAVPTPSVGGIPVVDITRIAGNTIPSSGVAGVMQSDIRYVAGGAVNLASFQTNISDLPTNAELDTALDTLFGQVQAALNALNDVTLQEINTEVQNILNNVNITVPSAGTPPTTVPIMRALGYFYSMLVNPIEITDTEKRFYNTLGQIIWKKVLTAGPASYLENEGIAP